VSDEPNDAEEPIVWRVTKLRPCMSPEGKPRRRGQRARRSPSYIPPSTENKKEDATWLRPKVNERRRKVE
jgi:hypothetical protein